MKVLLLNGSANKKGNTFTALTEIANRLEKNGVETEIMQLGNKPLSLARPSITVSPMEQ